MRKPSRYICELLVKAEHSAMFVECDLDLAIRIMNENGYHDSAERLCIAMSESKSLIRRILEIREPFESEES